MHNHQSAVDSFMEDKAIQDLEDAGIYPVPGNDAILENLYDEVMCGDWEAVKPDIADLHLLMSKLIYAQRKHND